MNQVSERSDETKNIALYCVSHLIHNMNNDMKIVIIVITRTNELIFLILSQEIGIVS